uniref:UDP-GlcNAc:betaGal beta-1,3-N-acetylglucosaminyltransferase 7-like isoform X1 n=1 Tax=Styela clava TaxID=7725 RepID=UPI00193A1A31|nr:UDP-GlcNAc:betaGal beta-1,3-N-acetylglucosaminyltransferase 7-like isoform X1 [Styela clava]
MYAKFCISVRRVGSVCFMLLCIKLMTNDFLSNRVNRINVIKVHNIISKRKTDNRNIKSTYVILNKNIPRDDTYSRYETITPSPSITHKISPDDANYEDMPGLRSMDEALDLPPLLLSASGQQTAPTIEYSQRRDHDSIISHNDTCNSQKSAQQNDVFLVLAIRSVCESTDRRKAIRMTWGNTTYSTKVLGVRIEIVFLLGKCKTDKAQNLLFGEDSIYSDILQWNFDDAFNTLTRKDCLFMQWFVKHCRHIPYVFKGDDDILVNLPNILQYLVTLPAEKRNELFVGSKLEYSPRITNPNSKYYVSSNLYSGEYYPPYVSGGGFLLSGNLTFKFFLQSLKTRIIPMDDAFMGIMAKTLGVTPEDDRGFKNWGLKILDSCRLAKIKTYHKVSPRQMLLTWKALIQVDLSQCGSDSDDVYVDRM